MHTLILNAATCSVCGHLSGECVCRDDWLILNNGVKIPPFMRDMIERPGSTPAPIANCQDDGTPAWLADYTRPVRNVDSRLFINDGDNLPLPLMLPEPVPDTKQVANQGTDDDVLPLPLTY